MRQSSDLPSLSVIQAEIKRRTDAAERENVRLNADAIRARCGTLAGFVREAWHVLEPNARLIWSWHIDAITDHLSAVTDGRINRLLINVPPGSMKSLLVSVLWQAWEWGPRGKRSLRYLTTAFNDGPVKRDTRKTRDLILSEWYQALWPEVSLTRTAEMSFANSDTGTREGVSFGSLTSQRGDRLIIDDPHSTETAESETERNNTTRKFREGALNRLNDQEKSAIVVIMQRLHEDDISGVILKMGMGYTHLMLPMEFEPERACHTEIGFADPRSYDGELLDPVRFPREVFDQLKRDSTDYAIAGQYQQRPAPREGGLFKRHWFEVVPAAPAAARRVRGWDLAASKARVGSNASGPAYTAGVRLSELNGVYYVEHVIREREDAAGVERILKATAESDGRGVQISIPQDPGQAGKPVHVEETILMANGARKRLADIGVGEFVIAQDGRAHRVSDVHEQGSLPCLRIVTESGRSIVVAPDHPFLTPEGWTEAGNLISGDTLALMSRPSVTVSSERAAEEYRLAGYFIGDGAVGRSSKATETGSCHAEFTCHDTVQMADFQHCVESLGGVVVNRKKYGQFGTKGIQPWLRDVGLNGSTAYTKCVPPWVFESQTEMVANFIGAYFACDGTVSKTGDEVAFYSVSKGLLEDIQHLLLRLGIASTLKTKNGKYLEKRHRSWMLRLRQQDDGVSRFYRRVVFHHTNKTSRLRDAVMGSRFRRFDEPYLPDRIVTIENVGTLPCRCLTVECGESFCAHDFVVHNSQVAAFARLLAGFNCRFSPETGDKIQRADPVSAQAAVGNVKIVRGNWNDAFLEEVCSFPSGTFKDQVDALSRAFGELIKAPAQTRTTTVVGMY